jgi:hypothetical protein
MKVSMRTIALVVVAVLAGWSASSLGQEVAAPAGKTLAATMNVYVFPTEGQQPDQQSADEAACYTFAVEQTGVDPFTLSKQAEQQKQQAAQAQEQAKDAGKGKGASGAVKGAAAGALIGEIASDDPGEGAAYGAAAGVIAGRRSGRRASQEAQAQAQAQSQAAEKATAEQSANFKKAFAVCLEAKKYMVKF